MIKEFREFIMRGNVVDLAVGIIIGAAFGKIVTSFVNDILMPPMGLLLGKINFADLFINLSDKPYPSVAAAKAAGAPTINYGMFLSSVIDFVIVGFAIFLMIKQPSIVAATEAAEKKQTENRQQANSAGRLQQQISQRLRQQRQTPLGRGCPRLPAPRFD